MRGLCYCQTCQMISGGAGNLFMAVEARSFQFTKGSPLEFGRALFTIYLLPFEVTSVLILIAILGAVVLAKKEID